MRTNTGKFLTVAATRHWLPLPNNGERKSEELEPVCLSGWCQDRALCVGEEAELKDQQGRVEGQQVSLTDSFSESEN